ncbi:MAG TPA: sugar ABC transporter permease [Anaerolineales bacterium]|nr:sugar ABC transporter permease [Anaerolineales bacterium]
MKIRTYFYIIAILCVGFASWQAHLKAVNLLPIDYDEDDYLAAGQRYAAAIRKGSLSEIIDYEFNFEHPPLTKLVYGLVILWLPEVPLLPEAPSTMPPASNLPEPHFYNARMSSAVFGTLEVLALAILNPLAGLFLGLHTWQLKYTSQIMLEPLPALTSLLSVLAYVQFRRKTLSGGKSKNLWIFISAIFLGLTAAGKYTYCVVGLAILIDWYLFVRERNSESSQNGRLGLLSSIVKPYLPMLLWGVGSLIFFFIFNPRLWHDPLGRMAQSLLYHQDYAQSEHVRQAGFPPWQPFVWLAMPVPWHPGVFQVPIDFITTVFAFLGFQPLWKRRRVFALWLALALGILLIWPTKWPQYILILTAPLALAAAEGFTEKIGVPFLRWFKDVRRSGFRRFRKPVSVGDGRSQLRQAVPWLLPGLIALTCFVIFPLIYQAAMTLTDFNVVSIRDGIQGGVWRSVWRGLTGQEQAVNFNPFEIDRNRPNTVNYAGIRLFSLAVMGLLGDILVFNVLWTILSLLFQGALGVAVALILNQPGVRIRNLWRTIFILPWAIPEFVGALLWWRFFEPDVGWWTLVRNLPPEVPHPSWSDSPTSTLAVLLVAAIWYGFPIIFLAATAGLKLIPSEVYDAAAIDGAGRLSTFRYITWPLLLPLLAPVLIIRGIFAFNQFYLFYTLQPVYPLMTLSTLSYYFFMPTGFLGGQFAVSAVINILTVLILMVLILIFNRWTKAAEGVTYA